MIDKTALNSATNAVNAEVRKLLERYDPPYNSWHEAYAVIKEELDEFWEGVRENPPRADQQELEQIAATALAGIYQIMKEQRG